MIYLDATPIIDIVEARGGIAAVLDEPQLNGPAKYATRDTVRLDRAYHRMRRSGRVTVWAADRFCVHVLRTLPELVYGEAFFDGCDDAVNATQGRA